MAKTNHLFHLWAIIHPTAEPTLEKHLNDIIMLSVYDA